MLVSMIDGLEIAAHSWITYGDATIQGDRIGAITALTDAINAVSTISRHWLAGSIRFGSR